MDINTVARNFNVVQTYKDSRPLSHFSKTVIAVSTIFAALATLPLCGIGAFFVFRYTTDRCIKKELQDQSSRISQIAARAVKLSDYTSPENLLRYCHSELSLLNELRHDKTSYLNLLPLDVTRNVISPYFFTDPSIDFNSSDLDFLTATTWEDAKKQIIRKFYILENSPRLDLVLIDWLYPNTIYSLSTVLCDKLSKSPHLSHDVVTLIKSLIECKKCFNALKNVFEAKDGFSHTFFFATIQLSSGTLSQQVSELKIHGNEALLKLKAMSRDV